MAAGTLVLGYDASPGAEHALEVAIDLASTFGDRLVIGYGAAPPGPPTEESGQHQRALEEMGERATAGALSKAREAGLEAEVELVPKRPYVALTDLADREDARMIVVGSYGESPIRGAILGSTPHKLLHWAERPVLVVPASPA
jgi:nucleotide-binding universal stress UspA family protein